jgi:aspartate-semialdehyde dehydrogenase
MTHYRKAKTAPSNGAAEQAPRRRTVAVLGATGAVGQSFIKLLTNHPWFDLVCVAASERSAGKPYADAARWLGTDPMPDRIASMTVAPCDPNKVDAELVFSALDSSVATEVEAAFAGAGRFVLSNAKNYRMHPDVPLVIAEVNPNHLCILEAQQRRRGWKGGIITNGNCVAIVASLPLAPIHERFGIKQVFVSTMQAVSGAGYPGVASLDILGNVIPYIGDEEPKIESELQKFLGSAIGETIQPAPFTVSAHANRVPVEHGHTVCMSIALTKKGSADDVSACIEEWRGAPAARGLPSSPERPLVLARNPDRPQPRLDVNLGGGMTVSVGRVRPDPIFDVKLVAMGHNVIRGAAGASILNAELLVTSGLAGTT